VELGGAGALHAAFLNESSTRGFVQRGVAENPGPVGMTILFEVGMWVPKHLFWNLNVDTPK